MSPVPVWERPRTDTAVADHERRTRSVERQPPGRWIYASDGTDDSDLTDDSPPYINGRNAGGGNRRLRIRYTHEWGLDVAGSVIDIEPGDIVINVSAIYRPTEIEYAPGTSKDGATLGVNVWRLDPNGDLVYEGPATASPADDIPNIIWNETPFGTIDGVNDTFNLNDAPNPAGNMMVFKNGLLMVGAGADYTLVTSATFVFVPTQIPNTGDVLIVTYQAGTL